MVARLGTDTSPSSGCSSPVMRRNSVDLPAPLGPTRPTFSPALSWSDASTNSTCWPWRLLMLVRAIKGAGKGSAEPGRGGEVLRDGRAAAGAAVRDPRTAGAGGEPRAVPP